MNYTASVTKLIIVTDCCGVNVVVFVITEHTLVNTTLIGYFVRIVVLW